MPIKAYNPTTPARRGMTSEDYSDITTRKPLKSLVKSKKQNAGRNNHGRITTRHRGGGVKRHYRLLNHNLAAWPEAYCRRNRIRSKPFSSYCPCQRPAWSVSLYFG